MAVQAGRFAGFQRWKPTGNTGSWVGFDGLQAKVLSLTIHLDS